MFCGAALSSCYFYKSYVKREPKASEEQKVTPFRNFTHPVKIFFELKNLLLLPLLIKIHLINLIFFTDVTAMEIENGTIITNSIRHPPFIFDPYSKACSWLFSNVTKSTIDWDRK